MTVTQIFALIVLPAIIAAAGYAAVLWHKHGDAATHWLKQFTQLHRSSPR
jgi:hypothetical protein